METIQMIRSLQSVIYRTISLSLWTPGLEFVRSIPIGTSLIHMEVANPDCNNCSSQAYWQIPPTLEDRCYLLETCCESYVFDNLRTKKQLGYITSSYYSSFMNDCGFTVIVQSNEVGITSLFTSYWLLMMELIWL